MKFYIIFVLFLLVKIAALAAKDVTYVYSFDAEIPVVESSLPIHEVENNQQIDEVAMNANVENVYMQKDNENARRQQLCLNGLVSIMRSVAIIQIVNAQYPNDFGTALKFVAVAHALYGIGLVTETMYKHCACNNNNVEAKDVFQRESERDSAKNYALTGFGNVIGGIEGFLFAFAAPDDPLAQFAIVFGAAQCLLGSISCIYPGYLMLKDNSLFKKHFLENDAEFRLTIIQEKLEKSRKQQFLSMGCQHIARGAAVVFSLSKVMPSRQYADMLKTFGSIEFGFGAYALFCHPFIKAYHYLKGMQVSNDLTLEEGSRNFAILRAVGFLAMAPVNAVYTLGVPDAKTPWILGASALTIVIAIASGWNPVCDYYDFESLKCKKPRVLPEEHILHL